MLARVRRKPTRIPRAAPDGPGRARPSASDPPGAEAKATARGDEVAAVGSLAASLARVARRALGAGIRAPTVAHEFGGQTRSYTGRRGRAKALLEADLGLVEEARASAEEASRRAGVSVEFFTISRLGVLGRLELALGDVEPRGAPARVARTAPRERAERADGACLG